MKSAAERGVWGPFSREDLDRRNGHIKELYAMGWSKRKIAELVGLTPERVHQILVRVA